MWVYPFITKQNGITTSKSIYVVTNNGKSNVIAVVNTWGKKNKASYEELYQDIINKVPNVLVGYSKENMEKLKKCIKIGNDWVSFLVVLSWTFSCFFFNNSS